MGAVVSRKYEARPEVYIVAEACEDIIAPAQRQSSELVENSTRTHKRERVDRLNKSETSESVDKHLCERRPSWNSTCSERSHQTSESYEGKLDDRRLSRVSTFSDRSNNLEDVARMYPILEFELNIYGNIQGLRPGGRIRTTGFKNFVYNDLCGVCTDTDSDRGVWLVRLDDRRRMRIVPLDVKHVEKVEYYLDKVQNGSLHFEETGHIIDVVLDTVCCSLTPFSKKDHVVRSRSPSLSQPLEEDVGGISMSPSPAAAGDMLSLSSPNSRHHDATRARRRNSLSIDKVPLYHVRSGSFGHHDIEALVAAENRSISACHSSSRSHSPSKQFYISETSRSTFKTSVECRRPSGASEPLHTEEPKSHSLQGR